MQDSLMAPTTRTVTNGGDGIDPNVKNYLDNALAEIRQSLVTLTNTITTMTAPNNQLGNSTMGRQPQQYGRMAKVEFPRFQGEDVRGWIFKCEQFFLIDNTPDDEKVKIASVHLSEKALLWHRQFIRIIGENVGWEMYKTAIIQRFGSINEDPMAALKNAKYEKSAKEYQDLFDTLLCRVDISPEHAISLYLGGLPPELEMSVRMFRPMTLADAYNLTNLQEATLEAVRKKNRPLMSSSMGRFGVNNPCCPHHLLITPGNLIQTHLQEHQLGGS